MLNYMSPRKDFERNMINEFFSPSFFSNNYSIMRTDISENENEYLFEVELPGMSREDVKISLKEGYLKIHAEKNTDNNSDENEKNYVRKERYYESAERSFYVGNIDVTQIKAKFANGILNISVPKQQIEKADDYIAID